MAASDEQRRKRLDALVHLKRITHIASSRVMPHGMFDHARQTMVAQEMLGLDERCPASRMIFVISKCKTTKRVCIEF